ncbi:hypothetical protein [Pararhizobium sp.]|uniref:hypothetical protein n=1 Tax=Pararhizobium sp. TaxID=1977563 RepID=UPI003D09C119
MKNKLSDLNNHLFAQLERLSDEDVKGEDLEQEVARAQAVVSVSDQIVRNADLQLKAVKFCTDNGHHLRRHLPMLEQPKVPQVTHERKEAAE